MKFKIWKNNRCTFELHITKRYKSNVQIIPIGCDCHPAYMLNKTGIRNKSLPFDWLDTNPKYALQYALENIKDSFKFFMQDLQKNGDAKVFAKKYPFALFYHYDDLITNKDLMKKIEKRSDNLISIYNSKSCYFLHTVTSTAFNDKETLHEFVKTANEFSTILKDNSQLLIYLRYDESFSENELNCEEVINQIQSIKNCRIVKYIRQKEKYGIWGDESQYLSLLNELGIKRNVLFPSIKIIKKEYKKC